MMIPWATDAPIYHRPWATMGLMAATIGVFVATMGLGLDEIEPYELSHGEGLHPIQWLTSNFIHEDIFHLVGNLIFLWAFALVVEGKVGFFPFLAIYLGIGIVESGAEQVLTLGMDQAGTSNGASAIIYGLMAMAMVWAPRNDLSCLLILGFRVFLFDMAILWFAALYLFLEALGVVLHGATLSTELLHVSGAAIGFGLATLLLKMGWVACEEWDLYSVWGGHVGRDRPRTVKGVKLPASAKTSVKKRKRRPDDAGPSDPDARADVAAERMRRAIAEGNAVAALAYHDKASKARPGWRPTDPEWLSLIQLLASARDWSGSVAVMEDYLQRAMKPSARVRLRLAQVLIREQQRPVHALSVLEAIPEGSLAADLEATRRKLVAQAEQMRDDGVLELDGKAW